MSLIQVRKRLLNVETVHHEGGPVAPVPLRLAAAAAVVRNPYAGRHEPDLLPFMAELRSLGRELADELVGVLGKDRGSLRQGRHRGRERRAGTWRRLA